ncbi:MerR family transcriptional regulator [Streptococcus tangpeifui]|uniref:MerR family transcriptional regulator n=1 Tax=Streptococcus tangpeifui TaxID=2709400 RepID=UPI0013EB37C4|nr:MerR family transcriptional regulator [Streptococcus sp. ZJ1593]
MTKTYSTGELAKLVGVSVRTVQYYDQREILTPSQLTEGGRRIYTASDAEQLKLICFLRDMDFSIEDIKTVLSEDREMSVLQLLLKERIADLKTEIADKQGKLDTAVNLLDRLKKQDDSSLKTLSGLSLTLKNQKAWRRLQWQLWGSLVLVIVIVFIYASFIDATDYEWTILLALPVIFLVVIRMMYQYHRRVVYLCPNCHQIFNVSLKAFIFASHTPRTRKFTCPHCQQKSFCLELAKEVD